MSIWVCYTEVGSEPMFQGYVRSKTKAIEWVKGIQPHNFNDRGDEVMTESSKHEEESERFAIAVKVELMESEK